VFSGTIKLVFRLAALTVIFAVPPAYARLPQSSETGSNVSSAATTSAQSTQAIGSGQTQSQSQPQTQSQSQTQTPPQTQSPSQTQTPPPAQTTAGQDKKDPSKDPKDDPDNPKNDRIFLVLPNFGTVEHPGIKITPLPVKEKFKLAVEDSFDTYSVPLAGIVAAISQANNDDAAWGQGWGSYGKRFAAGYADTVIGSFMTSGVFPSMLREDPRYFRLGTGSFRKRSAYAMKKIFTIRMDSGGTTFNFSEFGGNAAAAGISLIYHTRQDRNVSNFFSDYATQIGIDVFANELKEFWPDIRQKIMKKKK
jgi:hypothetical protein